MGKAHVAIVCRSAGAEGSVAKVAVRHAQELSREFLVTLVSDSLPAHRNGGFDSTVVVSQRFDYLRRFGHALTEYAFAKAVGHRLNVVNRDRGLRLLMCHSHAVAALAGRHLKAKLGIPYALVVHGDIFERPRGTYDPVLTVLYKAVTPLAYREADLVLAVSPHVARRAISAGASPGVVVVLPNGIDPSEIGAPEGTGQASDVPNRDCSRIQLLYVGRYSVEKGVKILIDACRLVRNYGLDFELRLIGSGPLERELREAVAEAGLSQDVTFFPPVERPALRRHYEWADVLCVPSLSDSLPTVVLEALTMGRAVLGTDTGGIPWMVENGLTGAIVPPGSPVALADAIMTMAKDPTRLQVMASHSRSSVDAKFSWSGIGEELRAHVAKLVCRTKAVKRNS